MQGMEALKELEKKEQRWYIFIDKIIVRMDEFCVSAKKELIETYQTDTDIEKRSSARFLASIKGQMTLLSKKVNRVNDEELQKLIDKGSRTIPFDVPEHDELLDIASRLSDKLDVFEEKWNEWLDEFDKAGEPLLADNLETKYKSILAEYDRIKADFKCSQCGGPVHLDKIFFISAYIGCSACGTQNTFEPSSQAKELLLIAPALAESRVRPLYDEYEKLQKKHKILAEEVRLMDLERQTQIDGEDAGKGNRIDSKMSLNELATQTNNTYKKWLKAKYDELSKIAPDLKNSYEAQYDQELKEF